ncbi:MAG: hypothetical protein EA398_03055 [Deltaproteobacteria bacterium]|nr:MAG: hypothetical protein EA398_03055 [Deltaproteobacteria bacterium]
MIPPGEEPTVGFCFVAGTGVEPRLGTPGAVCEPVQQLLAPSPFDRLQTDLMPGTEYTVAAYAQGANGIAYGESIVFRTVLLPVVTSSPAGSVTATSARLRGNLVVLGEPPATRLGYCLVAGVDTPRDGQPGTFCRNAPGGTVSTGPFEVDVVELLPGTTYSFAPFADTDAGRVYGETASFQTQ